MDTKTGWRCGFGVSVKERDNLIGRTCGKKGDDIVSWDNEVTLNFRGMSNRGFVVNYIAIVQDTIEATSSKCKINKQVL